MPCIKSRRPVAIHQLLPCNLAKSFLAMWKCSQTMSSMLITPARLLPQSLTNTVGVLTKWMQLGPVVVRDVTV
ncbi:hypothetical protein CY34DRAFT_349631 [Suillus luteus UH-Slu-Lm8-n1]|uniref:Uncharacterized protein n=1 Tax=Suillus luteus UH-Slu-Lm8-n1 TaxID=930992 RepID=A0A0C9ZNC4_9AGAM|nr:hypothetical protein CY34DRAFT_349631 [Suillus luteus UH-Slu-Lm8-n1]